MEMVKVLEPDFLFLKGIPVRKIYWKIRSIYKLIEKGELPLNQLPTETLDEKASRVMQSSRYQDNDDNDDEFIPPSLSSASFGKEKLFSSENAALIRTLCKHQIDFGGIGKEAVTKALESSEEGRELLRDFSLKPILNRVKYERRRKIRK